MPGSNEQFGYFSKPHAQRIAAHVRKHEGKKRQPLRRPRRRVPSIGKNNITVQAPATGIPAASNYEFGVETCIILSCDSDTGIWKDSGTTVAVHNPSNEDELTEGLRLGWAIWDGAKYILISKLCGDDRTFEAAEELDLLDPVDVGGP
jgi:hypothetical protein